MDLSKDALAARIANIKAKLVRKLTPEWNEGQSLPELGKPFIYNKVACAIIVNAGRKMVVDLDAAEVSIATTILIFGGEMSLPLVDVLVKTGVATKAELAKLLGDKNAKVSAKTLAPYFKKFDELLEQVDDKDPMGIYKFADRYHLGNSELASFISMMDAIQLSEMFGDLLKDLGSAFSMPMRRNPLM